MMTRGILWPCALVFDVGCAIWVVWKIWKARSGRGGGRRRRILRAGRYLLLLAFCVVLTVCARLLL